MKKFLFIASAILAIAACSKIEQPSDVKTTAKTITLKAGISNVDTKLAFDSNDQGITSTFEVGDVIYVFDKDGNKTDFTVTDVDANGIATFSGAPDPEINEGDPIKAVVKNSVTSVDGTTVTVNLLNQTGTLANAGGHTLIYGTGTYSSTDVSLNFEHKTSIVKFTLSLPESETATSVNGFYLFTVDDRSTVTDQNGDQFTYYNTVSIDASTGDITYGKATNVKGWINWKLYRSATVR